MEIGEIRIEFYPDVDEGKDKFAALIIDGNYQVILFDDFNDSITEATYRDFEVAMRIIHNYLEPHNEESLTVDEFVQRHIELRRYA